MQWSQVSGILDRVLIAIAMYAVAKGWISQNDAMQMVALVIAIGGAVWGWYVNRDKALVQAAAAIPGTTVVTTPALSKATPEPNIVSSSAAPGNIAATVANEAAKANQ